MPRHLSAAIRTVVAWTIRLAGEWERCCASSGGAGASTIRTLLFERAYGVAALVTMAGGVVMAGIGRLLRDVG